MKTKLLISVLFILTNLSLSAQVVKDGLLGYYPFTGNTNDESQNENHATNFGASLTSDRFGENNNAYSFDGSDYMSLNSSALLINEFSWSVWVKPTTNPSSGTMSSIISIGEYQGDQTLALCNNYGPSLTGFAIISYYGNNSFQAFSTGSLPATNQWYHLLFVRSSNKLELYINGDLAISNSTSYQPYYSSSAKARIGSRSDDSGEKFTGDIDDIQLYNKPLSDCEVSRIYDAKRNNLLGYYPFTGNANDESGNDNHGVISNAILTSDISNENDSAYGFDGTSGISINATTLTVPEFTYSVWVKPTDLATNNALQSIISIGEYGGDQTLALCKNYGPQLNGFTIISYTSDGVYSALSTGVLPKTNQWYHLIYVRSNGRMELFVNGELAVYENLATNPFYASASNAKIGARSNGIAGGFKGTIDEVNIYDKALSDCEILNLYQDFNVASTVDEIKVEISIYPNPAPSDNAIIKIKGLDIVEAKLFNHLGQGIFLDQIVDNEINLPSVKPGLYQLSLLTKNGEVVKRIILY
jgi:hypothetical protein